jgi:putative intracellular protease/amidase
MTAHVVAVAVTDGVPVFEFAVACEVFGVDRSDIVEPWYELRLCAAEPGPLYTTGGLQVHTSFGLPDLASAVTVLVPALARRVQLDPPAPLVEAVRTAHQEGNRVASICTGAYVLAAAALQDDRPATTHWMNALDFAFRFPRVRLDPNVLYVDDGDVLTSAGTAAGVDLCLHMVRRDHGAAVANEVARRMVLPPHREGGQPQPRRAAAAGRADNELGPVPARRDLRLPDSQPPNPDPDRSVRYMGRLHCGLGIHHGLPRARCAGPKRTVVAAASPKQGQRRAGEPNTDARLLETGGSDRTTERAMAERAGATISYFNAGHLGLMSDPKSHCGRASINSPGCRRPS